MENMVCQHGVSFVVPHHEVLTTDEFHFLTYFEGAEQFLFSLFPITSILVGSDILIREWVLNHLLLDACTQGAKTINVFRAYLGAQLTICAQK